MGVTRKRGRSLEDRLLAIRAETPEETPAPISVPGLESPPLPAPPAPPAPIDAASELSPELLAISARLSEQLAADLAARDAAEQERAEQEAAAQKRARVEALSHEEPVAEAPIAHEEPFVYEAPIVYEEAAVAEVPVVHEEPHASLWLQQEQVQRLSATEGDTFLPADHAASLRAVESAVRELTPKPATPAAEQHAPEAAPDDGPPRLSRLLTSSWLGSHRGARREVAEAPVDEVAETVTEAPLEEVADAPAAATHLFAELIHHDSEPVVEHAIPDQVPEEPDEIPEEIAVQVAAAVEPQIHEEAIDPDAPWTRRIRTEKFGRIGTTMIERGLINNEQLDEALAIQRTSGRRVGDILVELGAVSSFELARVLADHMGVPFTDLRTKPPDPVLAALLPEEVARRYDALPIARWNEQLVIAMANPTDLFALDDLQMVTRQPIIAAMAVKEDLRAAIDRVYRVSIVETTLDAATTDYSAELADLSKLASEVDEGPIVGLLNALMLQAVTDHASDLHIEPSSTRIAIRFRIDGVLHDSSTVPLELLRPLVSRVKILAGLDIAQNRKAQDGRFSLTIEGRSVDVRVVTMPTAAGEAVILRLLDPVRDTLGVASLGLSEAEKARFIPSFFASQGAVFIAGPTGSGKTSTIYAVLSEVNTRAKSIVSIEDPVEFRLDGIKQMQINPRVGLTFPTTLPSVLRADPDVVFIGEVRDTETARIAADASITGHLVLSTVHATRAAAAPMRLVEMGVEPYLVASALTLVASQRLARTLCELCAAPAEASDNERLRAIGADDAFFDGATIRRSVGCPACRGTGYRGRLPIFEIMPVTEGISRLILERASRAQIESLAVEEGMDTLRTAAMRRVAEGALSVDEIVRVIS